MGKHGQALAQEVHSAHQREMQTSDAQCHHLFQRRQLQAWHTAVRELAVAPTHSRIYHKARTCTLRSKAVVSVPADGQSVSHSQRTEPSTPTPFAIVAWEREGNVQALVDSKLEELAFHAVLEATSNAANVDSTTAGVAFLNDAGGDWL